MSAPAGPLRGTAPAAAAGRGVGPLAAAGWQLAFGEVIHRRLRPRVHAFRYPAFFVRLPAHALEGQVAGNGLFGLNRAALLSFHERDHGQGERSATPWLRALLKEAAVEADGELWLHAFPRVLGYAFKPVSFWFCHRADGGLAAVVAEVNNTFGERHCYLLAAPPGDCLRDGQTLHAAKVFHVSPFCDAAGSYRFRFLNGPQRALARVEHHDDVGALLLTSLSGRLQPLSSRACARALLAHPLFTLGVIARIHWQALRLFLQRVPLRPKPAPPAHFITRGSP
jgi:DUF1365 family protein